MTNPDVVQDEGDSAERAEWMGVLARADAKALAACVAELGGTPEFDWLRRPEFGAVMTRARTGGAGQAFSLGEMTVTRCALRLKDQPSIVGHAYVQGRDARKAEHAAILDAMLQSPADKSRAMSKAVEPLRQAEAARRLKVRRKAGASKVDFFTMVRAEG